VTQEGSPIELERSRRRWLRCRSPKDGEPAASQAPNPYVRQAGVVKEPPEDRSAVQADMARLEPTEDDVGDARRKQIRARVTEDEPTAARQHSRHLGHRDGGIREVMARSSSTAPT
jgi:hypothetical protein